MTNQLTYVYLQKNYHIVEGNTTACGLDVAADVERTEQATAPHCLMCWVKRGGSQSPPLDDETWAMFVEGRR